MGQRMEEVSISQKQSLNPEGKGKNMDSETPLYQEAKVPSVVCKYAEETVVACRNLEDKIENQEVKCRADKEYTNKQFEIHDAMTKNINLMTKQDLRGTGDRELSHVSNHPHQELIVIKGVNQEPKLNPSQEPNSVDISDNFKMHNILQESNSNNPEILRADGSESAPTGNECLSHSATDLHVGVPSCSLTQVKQEIPEHIQNAESLHNHTDEYVSVGEDGNGTAFMDKEIMNLNELVIESENSPNILGCVPKRRGRPKGSGKSMKSKTTLHNKGKRGKKGENLGRKSCADQNKKHIKSNKFKGAKEMRVQIPKLQKSIEGENQDDAQSFQNLPLGKCQSKRKQVSKICKESKSAKKRMARIETDIEIKLEPESSDEDNFDNDPDYFPIKEEPESPGRGKRPRIGRPPKIGCNPCKKCDARFPTKRLLLAHQRVHSLPKQSCRFCDFEAKSVVVMMEHEAKHTHEKPFKCDHPDCDYASRSNVDLQRHKSKHSTEKKFKCPYENCDFVTKWQRNIRHHVLRHTDERPYPCHLCPQSFKRVQDLKYHLYRHSDDKPIACDECDFRCKTNFELKCHKLKHSDVRNYACTHPGCTQRTKSKSDLTKHMKIHSDHKDYICDECGKGFRTRACLSKHLQRHSDIRPYSCDICNRAFKVKVALRKHVVLHSEYRPFSCEMCGQKFSSKSNKNVHMKTHDYSDRPYPCPVCPYAAKIQSHLLSHIGSMHGNSYAYFCEVCKKPFKRYGQLKVHHVRMHPEVDFGKIKTENQMQLTEMDDGTVMNFTFDENSVAGVEECINSVIAEARDAVKIEEKDFSIKRTEVKNEDSDYLPDSVVVDEEYVGTSDIHQKERKKRGRPRKVRHDAEVQKTNVKVQDMKVQSDAEKLHENLTLTEKLSTAAEDKDVKVGSVLENLDSNVTLTPLSLNVITEDLQSEKPLKNEDSSKAPATLTIYEGGFRLPLATKGFKFNFDKTGKKPKSWFMNPDNMHKGPREHQMKYLAKKDTEYKYYLKAQRKKMVGRNKVLESLERRRKSAAKRFATGIAKSIKRRHGKAQFRFTKVVEENEDPTCIQKQSSSRPSSLLESIPSQSLPKLIFKKKPDKQEEYECINKEEMETFVQNKNTEHEKPSNHVDDNEATESFVTKSSIKNIGRKKIESVQSTDRVCFKKRGRPKTKKLEKNVKNPTKNARQSKEDQQIKNSQPPCKKTKTKSNDIQGKKKKVVSESQETAKDKKRGRPRKSELESCVTKKSKICHETAVIPKKKGGRKRAQDKTVNKPTAGKGRRARRQKGPFVIEWETGDQEESVIKNEELDPELPEMEAKVETTLVSENICFNNGSKDATVPERLTIVDSITMEMVTSMKIEPPEQTDYQGNYVDDSHVVSDVPADMEGRLPDDLLVMQDYVIK
ncbi:uncharacterized protein LOC125651522 isoform X3 [Ostrea edulis]|uniref:uncharacterized protein LOC125651522 isoform X3 n=1 Tax=Ostrea edulis TaxID=37623 RepID=UPI0024AF4A5B|nr:uncharacterized protein LOC125651522 isoform X3 [Ostrea edulis]